MSFNFGSGSSKGRQTTQVSIPGPTVQEQDLQKLNVQLAQRQLAELDRASAQAAADDASPQTALNRQLEEVASKNLLARLTGQAPVLSPEEQARLDTIYGAATRQGEEDLLRFGQEIAGQRGMSVSDSPIGNELVRQRARMGETFGAQKASAALDLGQAQALFQQQVADWQAGLRQQALASRLALAAQNPGALFPAQQLLFQNRAANQRQTGNSSLNTLNFGGKVSGGYNTGTGAFTLGGGGGTKGLLYGG